jgi:hypothetical protein
VPFPRLVSSGTFPTGPYDADRTINFGSDTYTVTPQIGLIQNLGNGFYLDAAIDVAFRRDVSEGSLEFSRDPSTLVQAYLRYKLTPATSNLQRRLSSLRKSLYNRLSVVALHCEPS